MAEDGADYSRKLGEEAGKLASSKLGDGAPARETDDKLAAAKARMAKRKAGAKGRKAAQARVRQRKKPAWTAPDDDDSDDNAAFGPDAVPPPSSNPMDAPAQSQPGDQPSDQPPAEEAKTNDKPKKKKRMTPGEKMAARQKNKKGKNAGKPAPKKKARAAWVPPDDDDDDDPLGNLGPDAVPPGSSGGGLSVQSGLSVPVVSVSAPPEREKSPGAVTPKIVVETVDDDYPIGSNNLAEPVPESPRKSLGLPREPEEPTFRRKRRRGRGPVVRGKGKVFKSVFVSFDDVDWENLNKRILESQDLEDYDGETPSESEFIDPRHAAYFKKRERTVRAKADERVKLEQAKRREVEAKYNQLQRLLEEITAKNETFSPAIPKAPAETTEATIVEQPNRRRAESSAEESKEKDPRRGLVTQRFTNFQSIRRWVVEMENSGGFNEYGREVYVPPPQSVEAVDESDLEKARRNEKFYRIHRRTMTVYGNLKKFWDKLRVVCRSVKFMEAAMVGYTDGQRQSLQRMVSRMDDHFTGLQNHLNLIRQYHKADLEEVEKISTKSAQAFETKLEQEDKIKLTLIRQYETLQNAILWGGYAHKVHTTCVVVSGFPGELDHFNGRYYLQNPMIRSDEFPSWKRADPHSAVIRFFRNRYYIDSRNRHGERCVAKTKKQLDPTQVRDGRSPDDLEWDFGYGHYTPGHVFIESRRGDKLLEWKKRTQSRW